MNNLSILPFLRKINKLIKWTRTYLDYEKISIKNCKNSKITINGKVVFDDTIKNKKQN